MSHSSNEARKPIISNDLQPLGSQEITLDSLIKLFLLRTDHTRIECEQFCSLFRGLSQKLPEERQKLYLDRIVNHPQISDTFIADMHRMQAENLSPASGIMPPDRSERSVSHAAKTPSSSPKTPPRPPQQTIPGEQRNETSDPYQSALSALTVEPSIQVQTGARKKGQITARSAATRPEQASATHAGAPSRALAHPPSPEIAQPRTPAASQTTRHKPRDTAERQQTNRPRTLQECSEGQLMTLLDAGRMELAPHIAALRPLAPRIALRLARMRNKDILLALAHNPSVRLTGHIMHVLSPALEKDADLRRLFVQRDDFARLRLMAHFLKLARTERVNFLLNLAKPQHRLTAGMRAATPEKLDLDHWSARMLLQLEQGEMDAFRALLTRVLHFRAPFVEEIIADKGGEAFMICLKALSVPEKAAVKIVLRSRPISERSEHLALYLQQIHRGIGADHAQEFITIWRTASEPARRAIDREDEARSYVQMMLKRQQGTHQAKAGKPTHQPLHTRQKRA